MKRFSTIVLCLIILVGCGGYSEENKATGTTINSPENSPLIQDGVYGGYRIIKTYGFNSDNPPIVETWGDVNYDKTKNYGYCYLYSAAWLSEPSTALETAIFLMDTFTEPAAEIEPVLDYLYGKNKYTFDLRYNLDKLEQWFDDGYRVGITITKTNLTSHALIITGIERTIGPIMRLVALETNHGSYIATVLSVDTK